MFDIAWSELLLVAIVAILVVGPKELPGLLRSLGRMLGKLRSTADEFKKQFDEAVREAGGEDLQREMRSLRNNNPLTQIRDSIAEIGNDPINPPPKKPLPEAEVDVDDLPRLRRCRLRTQTARSARRRPAKPAYPRRRRPQTRLSRPPLPSRRTRTAPLTRSG